MSKVEKVAKRLWVFDLDGPLMNTGELYERALIGMVEVIMGVFGRAISEDRLMSVQNDIDKKMLREINPRNGQPYLFHRSRFPLSLIRTYKFFCLETGKKFDRGIAWRLSKLGRRVFDEREYERTIRPQVFPLFKSLKEKGDKVFILTKGADDVQLGKKRSLEKLGILDYCDGFIVVPDTKDEVLKTIKEENEALYYYCIGDTYLEDVLPGMNVGYFGIHIPYEFNWKERGKSKEIEACRDKKRSLVFKDVGQIAKCFSMFEKHTKK